MIGPSSVVGLPITTTSLARHEAARDLISSKRSIEEQANECSPVEILNRQKSAKLLHQIKGKHLTYVWPSKSNVERI